MKLPLWKANFLQVMIISRTIPPFFSKFCPRFRFVQIFFWGICSWREYFFLFFLFFAQEWKEQRDQAVTWMLRLERARA